MKQFLIPEPNMERLTKKLTRIKNKCERYGLDYSFSVLGEEFHNEDGEIHKYFQIAVEGMAVLNGWRFVATIEHKDGGNIIRQYDTAVEIPVKYRNAPPVCEHCNSKRRRRDTYIIQNEAGEFKQVGKSCLLDYTSGLSAENVAAFMEGFDLEDYAAPIGGWKMYYDVKEYLSRAYEVTRIFGFAPTSAMDSTVCMIYECDEIQHKGANPKIRSEVATAERMEAGRYNPKSKEAQAAAQNIIDWAKSFKDSETGYLYNLSVLCSSDFVEGRDLGILASAPHSYNRAMEREEERKRREQKRKEEQERRGASQHMGTVGEKLEADVDSFTVLTSFSTQWGITIIYKFVSGGNTIIWKTSSELPKTVSHISGRVKEHSEFNGEKQTVLTRCKVR